MRAGRLLSLLLLLQTRGKMTATELAGELEVSVRTVYRDMEALSAAGVPVYAEAGPKGGCLLMEGYRTRLTGLTAVEAETLLAAGAPGPLSELGLGTVLAGAQLKVLAALPTEVANRAMTARQRLHLDSAGWFREPYVPPTLGTVATAVWEDHRLAFHYRSADADDATGRLVDPLGLVLKRGVWYLVARREGALRTYRVSRVQEPQVLDEPFERPEGFNLASWWAESVQAYEATRTSVAVVAVLAPGAARRFRATVAGVSRADGMVRHELVFEDLEEAIEQLAPLGAAVEVLEPRALRERLARLGAELAGRYGAPPLAPAAPPG